MKIAQIVCTFPPYRGGIGNSVYNIAEVLSDLDHDVTVFTPYYNYGGGQEEFSGFNGKFTVERLKPIFKLGNAALMPQLFFSLGGFDVVHLHYPCYGALKAILARKLWLGKKMKLVLHYHMDSRAPGLKGAIFTLYRILFLPALARLSAIITCASLDYIKHSALKNYYRLRPEKFRQVLFGVDLNQFITYHDNLNGERQNKVILFVGGLDRAHYFKGLENLFKALAEIVKDSGLSSTILNVVGRGGLKDYFKARAQDLGVGRSVRFNDNVDSGRLVDFYNYCDCLVLPSVNSGEAFGLTLLEAMACSKPVITSNLPGVRSVFKNGTQGLLTKPGNVKDLAAKIKMILNDKNLAETMGRAGRELVEKKYTWIKVGKRLDLIYHLIKYSPS